MILSGIIDMLFQTSGRRNSTFEGKNVEGHGPPRPARPLATALQDKTHSWQTANFEVQLEDKIILLKGVKEGTSIAHS